MPSETAEAESTSPELSAIKNLFKTDLHIKRELIELAPKPTDEYNEENRMGYIDGAYHSFRDFKYDFLDLAEDFQLGEFVKQNTEKFFERGEADFALSDYEAGVTQNVYRQKFSNMRPKFIEEVKKSCVGYSLFGGNLGQLAKDATTINELLHAYHSYVMNNEVILQKVPTLMQKQNASGYSISLRGEATPLGRQVFQTFPEKIIAGQTDIVAVDGHVMMMVRDRGHALTIFSEPDEGNPNTIWVNYNIPKLCNEDMIKSLPGLAGYTQNGARGSFAVPKDKLGVTLANFIAKVPTDDDMPYYKNSQR